MKFDKENYKQLKKDAEQNNISAFAKEYKIYDKLNGVSVAFSPALPNGRGRTMYVAVSYCAPGDQFSKKIGKATVLEKYFNGEVIVMPIARDLRERGPKAVADLLLEIFTYL